RDPQRGLLASLCDALAPPGSVAAPGDAWGAAKEARGRPLVLIVDQVEESHTRGAIDGPGELAEFIAALTTALLNPDGRPRGKLVLGLRMEGLGAPRRGP